MYINFIINKIGFSAKNRDVISILHDHALMLRNCEQNVNPFFQTNRFFNFEEDFSQV